MLLELNNLVLSYGSVQVLKDISMEVDKAQVVTIIGANGAGKSTTLRTISGLAKLKSGSITFDGHRIDTLPANKIVAMGISHVPEGRRIFPDMTVEENLRTGAFLRKSRSEVEDDLEGIYLQFPILKSRQTKNAKTLSGGEQQMLAIGRALMARPRVLLMDEPSMGLAPVIVDEIRKIIEQIKENGVTILLVEQNAELALNLANYAYVLENGKIALEGPAEELHDNEQVRTAYLGI
ncbi:MAG: ABC transporter ATP-binding protein [Rhodobacteraceae bacterium]|nr:ABC transporter ATP-binding protein [Paracoccaceae bacterium]